LVNCRLANDGFWDVATIDEIDAMQRACVKTQRPSLAKQLPEQADTRSLWEKIIRPSFGQATFSHSLQSFRKSAYPKPLGHRWCRTTTAALHIADDKRVTLQAARQRPAALGQKKELASAFKELRVYRHDMSEWLGKLQTSTKESWKETKSAFSKSYAKFKESWDKHDEETEKAGVEKKSP